MKMKVLFSAAGLLSVSLLAAQASPADDVARAAQKLGNEANYSWHTTVTGPAGSPSSPGPIDGKIEKDGLLSLKRHPVIDALPGSHFANLTFEILVRGNKIVVADPLDPDGGWQTLADLSASDLAGPGPFVSDMMKQFQPPAAQATELSADSVNLTEKDSAYSGDLSPDAAKKLLAEDATTSATSGTVQFWVSNGELTKYEYKVQGTVKSDSGEVPVTRDTTVEIQNVGATTIKVPADAKKLLP